MLYVILVVLVVGFLLFVLIFSTKKKIPRIKCNKYDKIVLDAIGIGVS